MKLYIAGIDKDFFLNTVESVKPKYIVFDYALKKFRERITEFNNCSIMATFDLNKEFSRYKYLWSPGTNRRKDKDIKKHGDINRAKEYVLNKIHKKLEDYLGFCVNNASFIDIMDLPILVDVPLDYESFLDKFDTSGFELMLTIRSLEDLEKNLHLFSWIGIHNSLNLDEVQKYLVKKNTLLKTFETKIHVWGRATKINFFKSNFNSFSTENWKTGSRYGNTYEYVGNFKINQYHAKKGKAKLSRPHLRSKCKTLGLDYSLLISDDSHTVDLWNLHQFNHLINDLSLTVPSTKADKDAYLNISEQKSLISPIITKKDETELADYDVVKQYSRNCNSCFLSLECPVFLADSICRIDTRPKINNQNDLKNLLNKVIEIQSERVLFSAFVEKTQNLGINTEVSNEIEKLTRIVKDVKEILSESDEVTIKAKGSGVISKIFGSYGNKNGNTKPSQSQKIIDVSPMEIDDE